MLWNSLFEPARGNILGWYRFLFCSAIAIEVYVDRFFFQRKQASAFCGKLPLFEDFQIPVVGVSDFEILIWLLIVALVFAALGVGRRIPLVAAVVLFGYVVGVVVGCDRGVERAYTASNHAIVWQNLFILACAPGVNRWNLMNWGKEMHFLPSPRWPVELLKFNLMFAYFAGGVVKVRGGLDWMNGYTLQYHLLDRHLSLDIPMAYSFASSWWLCFVSSVIMVALELTCLVVFFCSSPRCFLRWNLFFVTDSLDVFDGASLDEVFWLVVSDLRFRDGRIDGGSLEKAG